MNSRKTPQADLRSRYPVFLQIGIILALSLATVAARVDVRPGDQATIKFTDKPFLSIQDVQVTKQTPEAAPPPRPQVPVAVPDDQVLDDIILEFDALPMGERTVGPPPQQPAEPDAAEPQIFVIVEEMPQLVGGLSALAEQIRYPEIAKRAGVEGRVIVSFVVDKGGEVRDAEVVRGIGAGCDEEALRAIQQMRFISGKQRGQPVSVKMSLPVTFRLK